MSKANEDSELSREKEVEDLVKYIKEEDPESCINILFVLEHENDTKLGDKDRLMSLMSKLSVKKSFLVECMHNVLYDNLLDFFTSIGKQKYQIHEFESASSSEGRVS